MLMEWQEKYPEKLTLKSVGKSSGYDIWCLIITSKDVEKNDKQHVVSYCDCIQALSIQVQNTVIAFGNWLLSGDIARRGDY